jgi:arsenite methyltransferase
MQEQRIKDKIKERYGRIALTRTEICCAPAIEFKSNDKSGGSCCSPSDSASIVGYDNKELESIPETSVLGVGCGAPLHHADVKTEEIVVDLGSGAGILGQSQRQDKRRLFFLSV